MQLTLRGMDGITMVALQEALESSKNTEVGNSATLAIQGRYGV